MPDPRTAPTKPAGVQTAAVRPPAPRPGGFVANGTIVHQNPDGSRIVIEHGHPIDIPIDHMRKLHRQGAVLRGSAPRPGAPGVEQESSYVQDPDTGLWTDAQGSTHGDAQPDIVAAHRAGELLGAEDD